MDAKRKAFYEYHAALMEPWDGPAAIAFTDGRQIGATLDRNGLRPARYIVTDDDLVILASESGVLPVPEEKIVRKWRLQPGKMLLIDLEEGRIVEDEEIKQQARRRRALRGMAEGGAVQAGRTARPAGGSAAPRPTIPSLLLDRQQAFGYTQEDLQFFLEPMARAGDDPVGSMGTDTPLAVLSKKPKLLYNYFKQNFAQVTNPPIDPIREELVMSLVSMIGPRPNLLGREAGAHKRLEVAPAGAHQCRCRENPLDRGTGGRRLPHRHHRLHLAGGRRRGRPAQRACMRICHERDRRGAGRQQHPDPVRPRGFAPSALPCRPLLATAAVHHHLIRQGLRMQTGLVVETGEAREVHHFCVLAGYGAEAINPYLAFETLEQIRVQRRT